MFTAREMLIYFSIISNGDANEIIRHISEKTPIDEKAARKVISQIRSKTLTLLDKDYPERLKQIALPPIVLYYYGDISLIYNIQDNISVVGSRCNTDYGKDVTNVFVKDLCRKYNIVSGLAKGIDSIAHRSAIANKGKTIAVLGSGIDYCYPPFNKDIYETIKKDGLLISEYPLDLPPQKEWFPMRNRIIAGLSGSLLVTEAKVQSGTAITVFYALQQGKEVFCVPHRVGENSGCNALIKEGAILVETADDIFYALE